MKFLGSNLPAGQIVFLRNVAASLVLLPVMLSGGTAAFRTARLWMHFVRGALIALGVGCGRVGVRDCSS